jgi:hypothetical protein
MNEHKKVLTMTPMRAFAGLIAGALAVLLFHQGMYFALVQLGVPMTGKPWNLAPLPAAYGMPVVLNQMFWGGLWGILFAGLYHLLPTRMGWVKGLLFGMVFPMLLGSWIIVPLIKGGPLLSNVMSDMNWMKLRPGFLLNGIGYGLGIGLLYPLLARAIGGNRPRQSLTTT